MTGRERGTLAALLVIALVAAVGFGGMKAYEFVQNEKIAGEKRAFNASAQPGEALTLDSAKDNVVLSNGESYEAFFGWTGKMEAAITEAKLYGSIDQAKKDLRAGSWLYEETGNLLVCTVRIKNIDAESTYEPEHGWFNITFLGLPTPYEYAYFDGAPKNAKPDQGENTYFDLPQGQEATYHVGFLIDNPGSDLSNLWVYAGVNHPYKYRFKLDIEDLRGARS